MLQAILQHKFLQLAVATGLLASILSAVIGVIVVEKKLVMMSGGITHAAYGGVGLGYFLGIEPILGAFGFALASAFGLAYIKRKGNLKSDVVIGFFWSLGMALGVLFISMTKGYPPDISSYLFGNILSVSIVDFYIMAGVTLVSLVLVLVFFNNWKAYLFDDKFARIRGLNVRVLDYLLFTLIAVGSVAMIRVVGIILVIALFTAPAAAAAELVKGLGPRMLVSGFLAVFYMLGGLMISYRLDISSGAAIVIIAVLAYFLIWLGKRGIKLYAK